MIRIEMGKNGQPVVKIIKNKKVIVKIKNAEALTEALLKNREVSK